MQGSIALAEVECNGMPIDVPQLDKIIQVTEKRLITYAEDLKKEEVYIAWKNKYHDSLNLNSPIQLADVLFNVLGHLPAKFTVKSKDSENRKASTDEDALKSIHDPFVSKYLQFRKLGKASGTYLKAIRREVIDGRLHCFFNLGSGENSEAGGAKTYRSSASSINMQNIPVRDSEIGPLIRQCFIPSKGNQLCEVDFSGAEVLTGVAYHQDPTMIRYLTEMDSAGKLKNDMHRDSAMELFKLPIEEITKPIRQIAKNRFVFREFYGGFYIQCANDVWRDIQFVNIKSGIPLREHLANEGITILGNLDPKERPLSNSFEKLCQDAEVHLWDRFSTYAQWRRDEYEQYCHTGWMQSLTGFIYQGYMKRNEVYSYKIQGSSFHCLLWSLIKIVSKFLKKYRMKTKIINEVHDSILADVVPSELKNYIEICQRVMTRLLSEQYPWLVLPMQVEFDVAPIDRPWSEKKSYKVAA